jgi:lipoate-protein ligase A
MPASEVSAPAWQLLIEPVGHSGRENMARDQALLDAADRTGGAFLRLYRWSPPCLSFGRNEPALTRYDRSAIERLGLDVVRRPTGGRAVWHDAEVTYAVAAPIAWFGSLRQSYRAIHERLAAALRTLGVPASLAEGDAGLVQGPCFASSVGGEIVVNGRKLVGSAQVRQGRAFLQHGSILLEGTQGVVQDVIVARRSPSIRHTTLREVLGRTPSFAEVVAAVVEAFDTVPARSRPFPPVAAFGADWTWRR